ncbi:PAS domain-containing protein [Maricaulaceae bacterium EIL42A08]|nr:PAS domain-containing protein [Maricaulaceae bacterium EIL42A08]
MRHRNSQTLLAYWNARRQTEPAPLRTEILPEDLGGLLANLFVLRRMDSDHHVFRLAGTGLCRMHRREFRDQNFLSLWDGHDRQHMRAALEGALSAPAPASLVADAIALDGATTEVELTLLPLRGPEGFLDRALGLYQPLGAGLPSLRPIVRHRITEVRPALEPDPSVSFFGTHDQPVRAMVANDV